MGNVYHDRVTDCADNTIAKKETDGATILKGTCGSQEKTSTDDTCNGIRLRIILWSL